MTFLTSLWLLSLIVTVLVCLLAYYCTRHSRVLEREYVGHNDLRSFITETLAHVVGSVTVVATSARPHTDRVFHRVKSAGRWGHNKFIDQVFGKAEKNKGRTASFFLKYIAENKEAEKGSPEQKAGY